MPDFRDQLRGAAGPSGDPTSPDALRTLVGRRRRTRRALVALSLVVLIVAGAAGVLTLRDRTTEIEFTDPPPAATHTPSPEPSATGTVNPTPEPSPAPSPSASPAAASEPAATQTPSPAPEPSIDDLDAALLRPGDLPPPTDGYEWRVVDPPGDVPATAELYDPCQPTTYPTDDDRVEVAVRRLRVVDADFGDAPETPGLVQVVARYQSVDVAQQAFAGLGRVARQCAATPTDAGTLRSEVLTSTATQLVIEVALGGQNITGPDTVVVERRGDVVVIADAGIGERALGLSDIATDLPAAISAALDRG